MKWKLGEFRELTPGFRVLGSGFHSGCIRVLLGSYRVYIGIMEKKMETTI